MTNTAEGDIGCWFFEQLEQALCQLFTFGYHKKIDGSFHLRIIIAFELPDLVFQLGASWTILQQDN